MLQLPPVTATLQSWQHPGRCRSLKCCHPLCVILHRSALNIVCCLVLRKERSLLLFGAQCQKSFLSKMCCGDSAWACPRLAFPGGCESNTLAYFHSAHLNVLGEQPAAETNQLVHILKIPRTSLHKHCALPPPWWQCDRGQPRQVHGCSSNAAVLCSGVLCTSQEYVWLFFFS